MTPDKDKPWTWMKFREGLCVGCNSGCCTMPVEVAAEDLVRIGIADNDEAESSKKKLAKKLIKQGVVASYRESTDLFMLVQRANGDCYYLHPITRLCTIYEKRPGVCRKFPEIGPKPGFCPASKIVSRR